MPARDRFHNAELSFAGLMGVAIGNMREEGVPVKVIQDNASKAKPVDFSAALAREEETEAGAPETPEPEG